MDPERQKLERVLNAYTSELSDKSNNGNGIEASENAVIGNTVPTAATNELSGQTNDDRKWNCTFSLQYVLFGTFYFVSGAALNVLRPYLSVYYHQLGLNAQEIGIIRSVQPWVAIPYTPLTGYLAAKYDIRRSMLIASLFGTAVIYMGLYFVPEVRKVGDCELLSSGQCVEPEGNKTRLEYVTTDATVTFQQLNIEENFKTNGILSIGSNLSRACELPHEHGDDVNWYNQDDMRRLFIYLILINVACQILGATWFPLSNAVVLDALGREKRNHYAYFKAFGAIACVLFVWVAGLLLDATKYTVTHCGITVEHVNFFVCFMPFSALLVISIPVAIAMSRSSTSQEERSINTTQEYHILEVLYSLCNLRHGSILLTVLWLSISTGKMRTFDNWYIEYLGGSFTLMAWAGLVGQSSLIFTLFALPRINDKVGHIPVLVIACIINGTGCTISGFISNPVWMIPPLFFREISVAVYMQSSGSYFANVVESRHQASMQTIMSSVTYGMGRGLGSLIGGGLFQTISPTQSYIIFAAVSFGFGLFLLFTHLVLEIVQQSRQSKEDGYVNVPKDIMMSETGATSD